MTNPTCPECKSSMWGIHEQPCSLSGTPTSQEEIERLADWILTADYTPRELRQKLATHYTPKTEQSKNPRCTNCKHSIKSHYRQSQVKTMKLPVLLVGDCKIKYAGCPCPGYEGEGQEDLYGDE